MPDYINIVIPPLNDPYTYLLPPELRGDLEVGCQVEVSFGRRHASGFVVDRYFDAKEPKEFEFKIKSVGIEELPVPSFLPSQIPFFKWIAEYYGEPLSNVLDMAIPHAAEAKLARSLVLNNTDLANPRGIREREILAALKDSSPPSYYELTRKFKGAASILKNLEHKGYLKIKTEELVELPFEGLPPPEWAKDNVMLNEPQQHATKAIVESALNKKFNPFLLHGITGSGKTEVYIEAIRELNERGLGSLVIVPEIALTPQLIDRFRARLGNNIAVLHSALNRRMRWNSWRALLEKRTQIAIGARSGIFAPVQNLSLIIVDEEHDSSYKQGEGIRYNARDLALVLGKLNSCPVVLGSATPSLESFYNARSNRYRYLSLPSRHAGAASADIKLVDLNRVRPWEMPSKHISPDLHNALGEALSRGEQAFILYNRRGFASYLQCEKCNEVVKCENCSVTMTLHRTENILLCHYCSCSQVVSEYCPACQENAAETPGKLSERGAGTEKIYDEVKELFPTANVERLDRDAASDHDTYRGILDRLRSGHTQILVGTQMIAKGHDLPNVTVVGIADCDVGLHLPDFRSAERIFQLLTQAAGRAGRGEKMGQVILQTRVPNHPSLIKTVTKDYPGFAEIELSNRKQLLYPPYSRILRIVVSSQDKGLPPLLLNNYKDFILGKIASHKLDCKVLGPAAAPLQKIKTLWRYTLIVKSSSATAINSIVQDLQKVPVTSDKLRVVFDVDPQEML